MASRPRDPPFVLIHSPLMGPTTWSPVARELERRGRRAVVPSFLGVAEAPVPQRRHLLEAARAATVRTDDAVVLVGHSGGGLLLPAIADALTVPAVALVLVDSFLPPASGSVPLAPAEFMRQLRALAGGGVLPRWSNWFAKDVMRKLVTDERLRAALEDEMPRLPLSYFEADVALPDGWDARPCGYLLLNGEPYGHSAADARGRGWPVMEIAGAPGDPPASPRRAGHDLLPAQPPLFCEPLGLGECDVLHTRRPVDHLAPNRPATQTAEC